MSLKNGADAPEPLTNKDIAGFDTLSNKALKKLIVSRYMKSGFNHCKIQPLKMMFTYRSLELFVDPNNQPLAIHKAAVNPVHLKAAVKADLDRDARLGILEEDDINSPVKWLLRIFVPLKKDGSP